MSSLPSQRAQRSSSSQQLPTDEGCTQSDSCDALQGSIELNRKAGTTETGYVSIDSIVRGNEDENWDLTSPLLLSSSTMIPGTSRSRLNSSDSIDEGEKGHNYSLEASLTIAAIFMAMSFVVLFIASFFFPWSDTMLRINLEKIWESTSESSNIIPLKFDLPLNESATFQKTLMIFQSSRSYTIVILIVLSTLIMPSIWALLQPLLICSTGFFSIRPFEGENSSSPLVKVHYWWAHVLGTHENVGRLLTTGEILMKFSLSVVYVESILLVCLSSINFTVGSPFAKNQTILTDDIIKEQRAFEGDNTSYIYGLVTNASRGGLLSYHMGISFGIISMVIVRILWKRQTHPLKLDRARELEGDNYDLRLEFEYTESPTLLQDRTNGVLSPPTSVFRLLKDTNVENRTVGENENGCFDGEPFPKVNESQNSVEEENLSTVRDTLQLSRGRGRKRKIPSFSTILLFESGIISTVFLLPMFTFPLFSIDYTGMASSILTNIRNSFTFWDIAMSIFVNSGDGFLPFLVRALFIINIIIIPMFSWLLCMSIWLFQYWMSMKPIRLYNLLQFVHPSSNTVPFALSLLATVLCLKPLSEFLFNELNICEVLASTLDLDLNGGKCLLINGTLQPGFWFFFLQGFCVDFFVLGTLANRYK